MPHDRVGKVHVKDIRGSSIEETETVATVAQYEKRSAVFV
jgi:hypothetical protein